MGIVFQDFRLLPDKTVYDNVAYAMYIVRATPRHIRRQVPMILSLVGLSNKAKMYPNELSGGEQQRVSIARAIAKNPRIYIFDDSFSALDFKTDAALRKALSPKVKESTVIIVAQRISTVLQAKQIIVLDDGKMVGKGTHKELMKNCEVYKQIASSQMSEAELAASLNEEVDKDE